MTQSSSARRHGITNEVRIFVGRKTVAARGERIGQPVDRHLLDRARGCDEVARASVSRPVIDRCMQCVILLRRGPERHLGRAIAGPTRLEAISLLARTSAASHASCAVASARSAERSASSPAARETAFAERGLAALRAEADACRESEGRSPSGKMTPCRRPATRPHPHTSSRRCSSAVRQPE